MKKAYGITMNNESYEIIPPTPSEDRGGITQAEYDKFNNYETEIETNKTDISQLFNITKGGETLSGSTGYSVDDSVDYPLVGLKVFGKSTQDGTPTPENPVEIISVVEPTVTVCGKNLLNINSYSSDTVKKNQDGSLFINTNGGITISTNTFVLKANRPYSIYIELLSGTISGVNNSGIMNSTIRNDYLNLNTMYTVTKDTDTEFSGLWLHKNAVYSNCTFRIMLWYGIDEYKYEPYTSHTITLSDTLNAIPVSSGGNVTIDGQEYIADYVDFERGVKVQRVGMATIDGSELWHNTDGKIPYCSPNTKWTSHDIKLSDDYRLLSKYHNVIRLDSNYLNIHLDSPFENYQTWVQNNPFNIYFVLATPIETPLSETELQAYRQLQTYNGVTNISNDKGAGLSVKYCTSKMLAEYALPLIKDLEAENAKKDEEISVLKTDILNNEKIHNRIYEGVNIAEKFASEIAASPYNGDIWAWIKARITAEDFTGIRVGDYIPFTTTNGVTLNAQITGINTYKNYGDIPVGAHIDFICKELWPTLHPINKVSYNNGTTNQNHPWLASDLYLYLNSLSGSVPNGTAVNPETIEVDYTTDGVYYYLPDALKSVIKEKRFLLPKRYSASGLLTDDNQWGWANIGKLWLPDECEVYGTPIWGGKGFSAGGSGLQYPLFAGNMNRVKFRNGSRDNWWLLSPYSGDSPNWCGWCGVVYYGSCDTYEPSNGGVAVPVCFRV